MVVAQEKLEWQRPSQAPRPQRKFNPRHKKRMRLHRRSLLALVLVVGVFGGVCAETIQLTVVKGAEINSLEKDISNVKTQNDLLQIQADQLRSVGRIESEALAMGMVEPSGTVYVAGNLPAVQNSAEATAPKVATAGTVNAQEADKPSALKQLSQIFTSFFASTQR